MSEDYQPIACHVHDEFEIAIMRAMPIKVELLQDGAWIGCEILPLDTRITGGEEFLLYRDADAGSEQLVRLDRIRLL